jgi:hypothetical protein
MLEIFSHLNIGLVLGISAFIAHIIGYSVYAFYLFHERIRPNAASWFMWLIGGWIEYITFDAIGESHWSTSALPFACVVGIGFIFAITLFQQIRVMRRHGRSGRIKYHHPDRSDYILTGFDLGAGFIWLFWKLAALANTLAVSTSIITFIPIWKTTYATHEEHPLPWVIWCVAYVLMFGAVLAEGGTDMWIKTFYPLYYFVLHLIVLLLCFKYIRDICAPIIHRSKSLLRVLKT